MTKEFYDRKDELALLRNKYEALKEGEMLALFGRRRVGKTELVKEFMGKLPRKEKFYFYVDLINKQEILNSLAKAVREQLDEVKEFNDYDDFFKYIEAKEHKFLVVIDEFQRFLEISPEFITRLQHRWDSGLKHKKIMIIIIGSSIGMMQRITESRAGALYGRAVKIKISPFRYIDFRLMFENLSEEHKIERYAIFGGTPAYLEKTRGIQSTLEAVSQLVLKKNSPLAEEPKSLMEYENVRVHANYNSILHSISQGKEIIKEIEDFTKLPATTMSAYIMRLDALLDIVGKKDPVLGKERLGRYVIKDNFFKFWYKFIFPNQTNLNLGEDKLVAKYIEDNLAGYVGRIFEDIIIELLKLYINKRIKGVDISFDDIGSWWDKRGNEIDIVAVDRRERKVLVGEVKWTNKPCDVGELDKLIERSKLLGFKGTYQFILVSKNGFTEECLEHMKYPYIVHLDLKEVSKLFDEAR